MKVRVAKSIVVPAFSKMAALVQSDAAVLWLIQNNPRTATQNFTVMANGVQDFHPTVPFPVVLLKFTEKSVKAKKNQVLGHALPAPQAISSIKSEKEVAAEKIQEQDLDETVYIFVEDLYTKKLVLNMLEVFQYMCYGHLGQIEATNCRINLIPDAQPVHQQLYQAGVRARQIKRIVKEGVIEPSDSD